ncbi:hypothetical protein ACT4VX_05330 [Acinetobacter baumannii]
MTNERQILNALNVNINTQRTFLSHLCDEEPQDACKRLRDEFLNHLGDEERYVTLYQSKWLFLNHLGDEQL